MKKSEAAKIVIIEKSAAVFNKKGYAGTSFSDLMKATGFSKGGLYGNFSNGKDEIAEASFRYAVNHVWQEVAARTRVIENALDKLKAVVYFYKERLFDPPVEGGCPILKTAVMYENLPKGIQIGVQEVIENWQNAIIKTLEKGKEKGQVKSDVDSEEFATLFVAILEGGQLLARTAGSIEPFQKTTRQLIKMIDNLKV